MTSQDKGRRFLVLGAGVLLIGSLGVGSASATDYSSSGSCVEVSTYQPPRGDGGTDSNDSTDTDSTDTDTDSTDTDTDSTDTDTDTDLPDLDIDPPDLDIDPPDLDIDLPDPELPTLPVPETPAIQVPIQDNGTGSGSSTPPAGSGGSSSLLPSGGSSSSSLPTLNLRAAPSADADADGDLDEGPNTLTTTDQGEGYDSSYSGGSSYHGSSYSSTTTCYFNYSVGHYWYRYRPVGEVYATQVKRVPSGGVDTGN